MNTSTQISSQPSSPPESPPSSPPPLSPFVTFSITPTSQQNTTISPRAPQSETPLSIVPSPFPALLATIRSEKTWDSFSQLLTKQGRLETFNGWANEFVNPVDLAEAGFFYLRESDKVQCVFCLGIVGDWEDGDIPKKEHSRHFPNCPGILEYNSVPGVNDNDIPGILEYNSASGVNDNDIPGILEYNSAPGVNNNDIPGILEYNSAPGVNNNDTPGVEEYNSAPGVNNNDTLGVQEYNSVSGVNNNDTLGVEEYNLASGVNNNDSLRVEEHNSAPGVSNNDTPELEEYNSASDVNNNDTSGVEEYNSASSDSDSDMPELEESNSAPGGNRNNIPGVENYDYRPVFIPRYIYTAGLYDEYSEVSSRSRSEEYVSSPEFPNVGPEEEKETFKQFSYLGIHEHTAPKHQSYSTYESRLSSFKYWSKLIPQKPESLAEAGLYYTGISDHVRCFSCDGGLRNWEIHDDPWVEHARWFDTCYFLTLIKGPEFITDCKLKFPPSFPQLKELRDNDTIEHRVAPAESSQFRNTVENKPNGSNEPSELSISEIKNRLESTPICKICMDKDVGVVFLPCGHVVSCHRCTQNFKDCPICRKEIKATVRTFHS